MTDRITVSLISSAQFALRFLVNETGLSKTEVVNRALQMHRFVTEETRAGNELLLRKPDGSIEKVAFL